MTFVQDAQSFLEQRLLPQPESEYVSRLLFREDVDVKTARAFHRFQKDRRIGTESHEVLEDRELEKQPYVVLLGNAGSGKSFILTFAYLHAIRRFLNDPATPFPLFFDLGNDLPTDLHVESLEKP